MAGTATAKTTKTVPCSKHTPYTKVTKKQCVAQYKKTVRTRIKAKKALKARDNSYWPPYPVTVRDLNVRGVNIAGFARLGMCEAGPGPGAFGVRWNTPAGWEYSGGLGVYRGTSASVGHPYHWDIGQTNWETQMLIGHRVMLRYGITAWGAHRCYTG